MSNDSTMRGIVAVDPIRRSLYLGGMELVNNHGDIDIYDRDGKTITRLQRADIHDIIDFLQGEI